MEKERPLIKYEKLSKEDLVDYCRVYWRRIHNDEVLFNEIYKYIESLKSDVSVYKSQRYAYKEKYLALLKANTELEVENRKLKEKIERLEFDVDAWHQLKLLLEWEIERLKWLQICWKTVVERIEDSKNVLRE